jgi:hypothetical protein
LSIESVARDNGETAESPVDDAACRLLWMRVLERLLNDAIGNHPAGELADRDRIQRNACSFFDARNIDFRIICLLAGFENHDRVLVYVRKTIADADEAAATAKKFKLPTFEALFGKPILAHAEDEGDDDVECKVHSFATRAWASDDHTSQ